MKYTKLILTMLLIPLNNTAAQQMEHTLDSIYVSAGRQPVSYGDVSRNVIVIDREAIAESGAGSLSALLNYAAGVDSRSRGTGDVQTDVSIRGASYEQTLILIDGIKMNDPQTGHHNMNLPVTIDNIKRVEILKGHASRIFGPNAPAGVINIITDKSFNKKIKARLTGGSNAYYDAGLSASYSAGTVTGELSFSKSQSDGYRYNTAFSNLKTSGRLSAAFDSGFLNINFGYGDKEFGANGFYSDMFPDQWERIITKFVNAGFDYSAGALSFSTKVFWRNNHDRYILDNLRPEWYQNLHTSDVYGAEIQSSYKSSAGFTVLGAELSADELHSSNLGYHNRTKTGFFAEHNLALTDRINISAGLFAYKYADIGWRYWPGADISWSAADGIKLYASGGKAFRLPTFTELYYNSPANIGNPALEHEETMNLEGGVKLNIGALIVDVSYFNRSGENLIFWVKSNDADPWRAENIAEQTTQGIDAAATLHTDNFIKLPGKPELRVGYVYIDSDLDIGMLRSKYLLDHLRHQANARLKYELPYGVVNFWAVRWSERVDGSESFITDVNLSKDFGYLSAFIRVDNLLDRDHSDHLGIPLPGRWIKAGIRAAIEY